MDENAPIDSRIDTYQHRDKIRHFMGIVVKQLIDRMLVHDNSKLETPEVEFYDSVQSQLRGLTYGSPEYKDMLKRLEPALKQHYANNRHHPEHYPDGMRGMNLVDLIELFVDWKAASLRHNDGNILRSVAVNQERFGYSDDLKQIFINTARLFEENHQ